MGNVLRLSHLSKNYKRQLFLDIEYFEKDYPEFNEPHRHDFHEILFFTNGTSIHVVDDQKYTIDGNDIFLLSEGQIHHYIDPRSLSGYLVCFKEYLLEESHPSSQYYKTTLFGHSSYAIHLKPNNEERGELIFILQQLVSETQKQSDAQQVEIISSYLKVLLLKLLKIQTENSNPKEQRNNYSFTRYLEFNRLLERHYRQQHEASWYAAELGISVRDLCRLCNQFAGENTKNLITKRLVVEARRLLQFSSLSVKSIAIELNFSDQFQFSKFFKQATNTTPSQYRKKFALIDMQ